MEGFPCRGCGRLIVFIPTRSGKRMPCDPERLSAWITEEGSLVNVTLQDPNGDVQRGQRVSMLTEGAREVSGYVPHWITCPRASDFRR